MARILITEFMSEDAVARLRAVHEVCYDPELVDQPERLRAEAVRADALVVRNRTQVRGPLLEALVRCRLVGRLGVGLDNIDLPACRRRGIEIIAATGANARAVAEYVIGSALWLRRGAWSRSAEVATGHWPRAALAQGRELAGATLGLIGFGSIGQLTSRLASALGLEVIAFDEAFDAEHPAFSESGARWAGLEEVITTADVVSLHVPLVESTRGLLDARHIASMKPGAVLINTARGGIVDERAVAQALRSGALGGAALDVFSEEPLPPAPHFEGCPNLLLTPHVAGLTQESNERVSTRIADCLLERLGAAGAAD